MEMPFSFECKECKQVERVATEQCVCFEEKLCSRCFTTMETEKEQENNRVVEGKCPDCNVDVTETVGWLKRQGEHAGTCKKCYIKRYVESDECKQAVAKEKAEFDAKPVREKMIILLDEIDSCQDAYHPSSLKGYHACLSMMKNYAARRMDFAEEGHEEVASGQYLWNMLVAVEEIASKYELHPSLEKCKEVANFLEHFTQMRWAFPNLIL